MQSAMLNPTRAGNRRVGLGDSMPNVELIARNLKVGLGNTEIQN